VIEQVTSDAANQDFPKLRMTVRARNDEISAEDTSLGLTTECLERTQRRG